MDRRFGWRRLRRRLVCRQAVEFVTDYLEGVLPQRDRARVEAHLTGCPHCTEYFEQMRSTIATLGRASIDASALPPAMADELIDLYRRATRNR